MLVSFQWKNNFWKFNFFFLFPGVYPILEYPKVLIDITGISDLKGFYIDQNLVIGSGNTLTEVLNIFDNAANMEYFNYLSVLKEHLTLVAHISVRNVSIVFVNT